MNDRVEEVQHHRKFMDKLEDEVDDQLKAMKSKNPAGVFYNICWSESYPGYVSLRFIMSKTPRHHTIGISPDGFVWGPKVYNSLDKLMNDFKKNPAGPGAKPPSRPGGSSTGSMSTSRQGTGGRTPEEGSRQSRWGARSNTSAAPPSRWGGTALPPPPAGPPPAFAAPPGQPPAFSYPPSNAPPGYTR